jgi:cation diffusion facilitator family transporter
MIYRSRAFELPKHLEKEMGRAKKLECITLAYLASVVVVMYLVMGSSQAMKTAWLEDVLGMFPAVSFLIASRLYYKQPTEEYPYGFHRVYGIAFLTGAVSLFAMGCYLAIDSAISLIKAERPTIGSVYLLGQQVWLGWIMILALVYSSVPAVFLGRAKQPLAKDLHNKILYTDADTQKADYNTAFAAMLGIVGVGFGLWWADAVTAILISLSVLKDGYTNLREAISDLLDRHPKIVDKDRNDPLIEKVRETVISWPWVSDAHVRFREDGQVYFGEIKVVPKEETNLVEHIKAGKSAILDLHWKVHDVTIMPVASLDT